MQLVKIEVPPNAKPTYLQHLSEAKICDSREQCSKPLFVPL